ncbi:MAC/perforin domain-containing protein [Sphingobacterium corticibacterium]|uniref:MACPF domain-containing protein n=1 Tax=Sphingobacterium corticibacterium TaxID=2484746 RepID=A0A4Q6XIN3_9SPHI|nr:MAC/perforin domain-containing protein [Sphingobacterium corticibacterium]RZF59563.1 hypothetical protein EWE74_10395 [Sphingobacterium corticibacterium]
MNTLQIKQTFFFALSVVIALSSCKKTTLDNPETIDPELAEKIELEFSVKNLRDDENNIDKEGYNDYNFLGYGYDITGKCADATSVREPVINTPDFVKDHTGRFVVARLLSSTFTPIYATDAEQFTKNLTHVFLRQHEPHSYSYFKGNIVHAFPETEVTSGNYLYGLYELEMKYRRLSLNAYDRLLTPYVTESFKYDCQSLSAHELIEKYGTHALISLEIGAKLSINYQAQYKKESRRQAVENSFRIGLKECFGLFSGFLDPVDSTALKGVTNPKIAFEVVGGDPSKIKIEEKAGKNLFVTIDEWRESVTEENARFAYLDGLENLLPISDLIEDVKKKQEVEEYIHKYIRTNEVKLN